MTDERPPLAVYYEHPDWFRPLFAELDRRGTPYARVDAASHRFDPADASVPFALVFNRMSPSAYLRGHANALFYTLTVPAPPRTPRRARRQRAAAPSTTRRRRRCSSRSSPRSACRSHARASSTTRARCARRRASCASPSSSSRTSAAAAPASSASTRRTTLRRARRGAGRVRHRRHGARAGVHPGARRPHRPRRDARRHVPLRDQGLHHRRDLQPVPGGHLRRERAAELKGVAAVGEMCPADAPKAGLKVERYDAARGDRRRRRAHRRRRVGIDVGGVEY